MTLGRRPTRASGTFVLCALVLSAASCASSASAPGSPSGQESTISSSTSPDDAVALVAHRLDAAADLVSAHSEAADPEWGPGVGVAVRVRTPGTHYVGPALWLGYLLCGAAAQQMATPEQQSLKDAVSVCDIEGLLPSGETTMLDSGMGFASAGQVFTDASDEEIENAVRDVAAKFGLTIREMHILRPLNAALQVTFDAPSKEVSLSAVDHALKSAYSFEGLLVQVYVDGKLFAFSADAVRANVHMGGRADQADSQMVPRPPPMPSAS